MTNQANFLQVYDQYADKIFRYCLARLGDRELAQEFMQETFTRTWKYLSSGREVEHIKAFLYTSVHNLLVDYYKKKKLKQVSLESAMEAGFEPGEDRMTPLKDQLDAQETLKILDQLKAKDRELLVLRYVEDLPVNEIAKILNVRENVVSVRLHRAINKLRNLLDDE